MPRKIKVVDVEPENNTQPENIEDNTPPESVSEVSEPEANKVEEVILPIKTPRKSKAKQVEEVKPVEPLKQSFKATSHPSGCVEQQNLKGSVLDLRSKTSNEPVVMKTKRQTKTPPPPPSPPPQPVVEAKVNKLDVMVECKYCGKSMTTKSLKYSHEKNCKGKPQEPETKQVLKEPIIVDFRDPYTKKKEKITNIFQQAIGRK